MDKLEAAMVDYESLINKKYIYELSDKSKVDITFKNENFPHVMGLHKLVNIKDLERLNRKKISGKKIYKELERKEITSNMIFNSPHYYKIEDRFDYFYKVKDLVFEKVIYDFDKSKVPSTIEGDLVLYTVQGGLYLHLFLAKRQQGYYVPMTFIVEVDDRYINGQTDHIIDKLSILEKGKDTIKYVYRENNEKAETVVAASRETGVTETRTTDVEVALDNAKIKKVDTKENSD